MNTLRVSLFGRFSLLARDQDLTGLCTRRMQELFCYLLLHLDRPHPRETLAGLLCGDAPTAQSKKSLRQTLWHLQTVLESQGDPSDGRLLQADDEWVQLSSEPWLFWDVAVFEQAFSLAHIVPVHKLEQNTVETLQDVVRLYQGDLLEGWYQDWCLYERERLQQMYLIMLDNSWSFVCGEFLDPRGWQRVGEPLLPAQDRAFYAAHSPAAPSLSPPGEPLVSCIMPTANRRAFVPHAIRYFLRQDYAQRELVVLSGRLRCLTTVSMSR